MKKKKPAGKGKQKKEGRRVKVVNSRNDDISKMSVFESEATFPVGLSKWVIRTNIPQLLAQLDVLPRIRHSRHDVVDFVGY